MLIEVIIAWDPLDPKTWTRETAENIHEYLRSKFTQFPATARIFHAEVTQAHDVTPESPEDIERLGKLPGPFFVYVYPAGPAAPYIFALVLAVAAYAFAPSVPPPPTVLARNNQTASPNNELSERSNRARINGRIPDIYGTVRSIPDLIGAPYKIFENNREVEYAFMCIGRGEYDITDVRDGDTLCSNIPGTTLQFYDPYTSPIIGDAPALVVGTPIDVPPYSARRSNSINGQVLRPPNSNSYQATSNVRFATPNRIELFPGALVDFTQYFAEGDELVVTDAVMTTGVAVSETVVCWATLTEKDRRIIAARNVLNYTYAFDPGSLVFEMRDETVVNGLFTAGGDIVLTQTADVSSSGLDLSGTYEIDAVEIIDPKHDPALTPTQRGTAYAAGAPAYMVVRLVSPQTVNADWSALYSGDTFNRMQKFRFEASHEAAASYDIDLDGTYTIVSVTKEVITLDNPLADNADWSIVTANVATPYLSPLLATTGAKWVGPFVMTDDQLMSIYCNFVAQNGLYKDDGIDQEAVLINIEVEVTPVGIDDLPLGDPELFSVSLLGSTTLKESLATTLKAQLGAFSGRCMVRARRTTESDEDFEGTVVDEVRWRDLYSIAAVNTQTDFGNVTTVQSVVFATASALAVKERKLNMLVTRRVPSWDGTDLSTTLTGTKDTPTILAAICRDKYIGNRKLAELDLPNFFAVADEVETYFGTERVREFCYTFDKDNVSFEEMVDAVARSMFCVAYRRGNVIKLSFERATDDSTLLFNHRNKVPGTEKRTVSFGGLVGNNDGIEFTYVDPRDDSTNTIFLPATLAAINPKKIDSVGVRNNLQAYFLAWRAWNRMLYQNMTVEFEACQEANLLVRNDRVLVADGTRPNMQDGEVKAVDGTELTLSQEVDLVTDAPYTIFLQHYDGSVEAIGVTSGGNPNQVVLDDVPLLSLVTDQRMSARTGYILVGATEGPQIAFLADERTPQGPMTSNVKAVNYDARYYANDLDFINDLIEEDGLGETGGYTPPVPGDTGYLPPEDPPDPPEDITPPPDGPFTFLAAEFLGAFQGVQDTLPGYGGSFGAATGDFFGPTGSFFFYETIFGTPVFHVGFFTFEDHDSEIMQDYWTSAEIVELGVTLYSAAATFDSDFNGDFYTYDWTFTGTIPNIAPGGNYTVNVVY